MRSTETAFDAARIRLRILGRTDAEIAASSRTARSAASPGSPRRSTAPSSRARSGPGQYVKADSGDALYVIADLSTMWLKAQIFEQDIAFVRVGQEIEVKVAAAPDRIFKARIADIGSASDLTTRRVMVRSEIPNPDGVLKSEMFASFKIGTAAPSADAGGADRGRDPRRRPGDGVGRDRADAVQAPHGRDRNRAGRPDADSRRPRCSANGWSRAARSSSTTSGVNEQVGRSRHAA